MTTYSFTEKKRIRKDFGNSIRDCDRAVLASGAANRDCCKTFVLGAISSQHCTQHSRVVLDELLNSRLR